MRSYQIHFILEKPIFLEIGRLGKFDFPTGKYVYTGSAKKNMEARIARHFSKLKRLRWHIDYLLGPHAKIVGVELFDREECVVNQDTKGDILVPGFGSTDCRNKCGSHLKYLGQTKSGAHKEAKPHGFSIEPKGFSDAIKKHSRNRTARQRQNDTD
jgi:Uri superfamily endonuclease